MFAPAPEKRKSTPSASRGERPPGTSSHAMHPRKTAAAAQPSCSPTGPQPPPTLHICDSSFYTLRIILHPVHSQTSKNALRSGCATYTSPAAAICCAYLYTELLYACRHCGIIPKQSQTPGNSVKQRQGRTLPMQSMLATVVQANRRMISLYMWSRSTGGKQQAETLQILHSV